MEEKNNDQRIGTVGRKAVTTSEKFTYQEEERMTKISVGKDQHKNRVKG